MTRFITVLVGAFFLAAESVQSSLSQDFLIGELVKRNKYYLFCTDQTYTMTLAFLFRKQHIAATNDLLTVYQQEGYCFFQALEPVKVNAINNLVKENSDGQLIHSVRYPIQGISYYLLYPLLAIER